MTKLKLKSVSSEKKNVGHIASKIKVKNNLDHFTDHNLTSFYVKFLFIESDRSIHKTLHDIA